MALINLSKFQVSKWFFRNPQIINVVIAIFSLFVILTGLRFFGLYEGMQQDVTIDESNDANNKTQPTIPTSKIPQMTAMSQIPPMPPMYQMGIIGQMPPMYQIPSSVPEGVSQSNIPVT